MRIFITAVGSGLAGLGLALFGVWVSVFADAPLSERLLYIAMVLGVYALFALLLGWVGVPARWPSVVLAVPGMAVLLHFMVREFQWYQPVYLLLLAAGVYGLHLLAARGAARRRSGKRKDLLR